MASFVLSLWEDLGTVVEVELADVLGGEERPLLLVRRRQHRRDQRAGARPGDHVEVVGDPGLRPVQLLASPTVSKRCCYQSTVLASS